MLPVRQVRLNRLERMYGRLTDPRLWSSYIGHEPSLLGRRIRVKLPDIDEAGASDWHSTTFHWTVRLSTIQEEIMAAV